MNARRQRNMLIAGAFSLVLASCHNPERKNPFDPELTPAVENVEATLDGTSGVVVVEWDAYDGAQPFGRYLVLRKVQGLEAVDTLSVITDRALTRFEDTSIEPDTDYIYRVTVANIAGFTVDSADLALRSFRIPEVELAEVVADNLQGTIILRWQAYRGPRFTSYTVRRRSFGQEGQLLALVDAATDTTWIDNTALPETEYLYWIETSAAGTQRSSVQEEAVFSLPAVELSRAQFSSDSASADLAWTAYAGPSFGAYEVRRQSRDQNELSVQELTDRNVIQFTDTNLDGNTEYTYRIFVRTTWGSDVGVFSAPLSGSFYSLDEVRELPLIFDQNSEIQAVGLCMNESDQLFVAATAISTTTARVMQDGIGVLFPGETIYREYFQEFLPNRLSPAFVAAGFGSVYVAYGLASGRTLVGAIDSDKLEEWSMVADTGSEFPVGLYLEENGELLMIDAQGGVFGFSSDGMAAEPHHRLTDTVEQELPLQHVVVGPGAGRADLDQFFLLAPERDNNHIVAKTRTLLGSTQIFGGRSTFDDGVGPEDGQTLNPLVMAFDRSRIRLVVLEAQGRLQVFNAVSDDVSPRYITKWGRFGAGPGEFQVSPPTSVAMVVDSMGRIYVADGEERIRVFIP